MTRAKVTHLNENRKLNDLANSSYSSLFRYLIDGVLVVNSLGLIEYMNPAYEDMFGVTNFALKGKSIYQTPNDEIVLTSLKSKKPIDGFLHHPYKKKRISVTSSLLMQGNSFGGVIVIYREEKADSISSEEYGKPNEENRYLPKAFEGVIGNSKSIKNILYISEKAAKSNATVLITGETGCGKGLFAEAIHKASKQASMPFVKINCGAIPYDLLESELFGHEQGAFTGAVKRKIGKFEQANGGTIFLDEIGDMPMNMQVKVLRIIQEKEFERVGGNESIQCDVRIIAATHRDLRELIENGSFREDLYYRLNVIPIHVPSLRERKEDIIELTYHYMRKIHKETGVPVKALEHEVELAFYSYQWPGNIRELKNLIERLMVLVEGDIIGINDIPKEVSNIFRVNRDSIINTSLINNNSKGEIATLDEYEREIIKNALNKFGSFNKAAKALGVTHKTVAAKARKYNIVE